MCLVSITAIEVPFLNHFCSEHELSQQFILTVNISHIKVSDTSLTFSCVKMYLSLCDVEKETAHTEEVIM